MLLRRHRRAQRRLGLLAQLRLPAHRLDVPLALTARLAPAAPAQHAAANLGARPPLEQWPFDDLEHLAQSLVQRRFGGANVNADVDVRMWMWRI